MTNKVLINKEDFIEVINDMKAVNKYHEDKNKFFAENGVDGYIFEPECSEAVGRLLHIIFGNYDSDNQIAQFCFQGNFGRKKKECVYKDEEGKETTITTAADLYDYLLSN